MKSIVYILFALAVTFMTACDDAATRKSGTTTDTGMVTLPRTDTGSVAPIDTGTVSAVSTTVQQEGSGDSRPNPPHGQPGHRCDIPVGAPLNSPPGQRPAATTTTTPVATTPVQAQPQQQAQPAQQTAPGMNPPHGQPGHRCDIAVGAPLNSAPAKK